MSRFAVTTWVAIAVAWGLFLWLPHPKCTYAVAAVWLVYLPIFICGLFLIRMNYFCPAICQGKPGRMKVALTFDDGPDPRATPQLLELLKREGISATFFCIGSNVTAHPEIAKRIAAEGHLLANHSYRHPWFISLLLGPWLNRELARAQVAIQSAAGVTPKYFRPPSGMTGPHFSGALEKNGLTLVGWDVRSLDTVMTVEKAVARILRLAEDGSIILLHDAGSNPARITETVSMAIKELRSRGFGFERLDRLIENT